MDEAARRAHELRRHERSIELRWFGGCALALLIPVVAAAALAGAFVLVVPGMGDPPHDDGPPPNGSYTLDGVAVTVTPTTGLAEGDRVVVASDALPPGQVVAVVPCLLYRNGAVDRCDEDRGARHAVPADGRFEVELVVPRVLAFGVEVVDCAEPEVGCAVLAADVDDRGTGGGSRIRFRDDVPPTVIESLPEPPLDLPLVPTAATLDPPSPVAEGDPVTVVASGFEPGEPVRIGACPSRPRVPGHLSCAPVGADDFLDDDVEEVPPEGPHAGADGTVRADVYLTTVLDGRGVSGDVDCGAPGCVLVVVAAVDPRRLAVVPVQVLR